jgi:hypothetical protein
MYALFDHAEGFICSIDKDESDPLFSNVKNERRLEKAVKLACAMVNEDEVEIKNIKVSKSRFDILSVNAKMMDGSEYECELYSCRHF